MTLADQSNSSERVLRWSIAIVPIHSSDVRHERSSRPSVPIADDRDALELICVEGNRDTLKEVEILLVVACGDVEGYSHENKEPDEIRNSCPEEGFHRVDVAKGFHLLLCDLDDLVQLLVDLLAFFYDLVMDKHIKG